MLKDKGTQGAHRHQSSLMRRPLRVAKLIGGLNIRVVPALLESDDLIFVVGKALKLPEAALFHCGSTILVDTVNASAHQAFIALAEPAFLCVVQSCKVVDLDLGYVNDSWVDPGRQPFEA